MFCPGEKRGIRRVKNVATHLRIMCIDGRSNVDLMFRIRFNDGVKDDNAIINAFSIKGTCRNATLVDL